MLKQYLTKAPLVAGLLALLVFVVVAGAGLGLAWPVLLAVTSSLLAMALVVAYGLLWRKNARQEHHFRQVRFIADRFQSMLHAIPGGYCLFTPQGILREEYGVAARFGVARITHLDDLIGVVKEGADLLEAFRKLQLTGEAFVQQVHGSKDGKAVHVSGCRLRIGNEGPHVDMLWFIDQGASDHHAVPKAAASAVPPTMAEEVAAAKETTAKWDEAPAHGQHGSSCTKVLPLTPTAFDALPFPIWGRDADLKIVLCNAAYVKALDTTPQAALDNQIELMDATSKSGKVLAGQVLATGTSQTGRDHVVVHGRRCLMEVTELPLPDDAFPKDGDAVRLLGFALDVTNEEDTEAELKRHLVSHHEVMEHLGAAICVYGADTRLEFYNRAYQRLWEIPDAVLDSKPTFGEILEDLRTRRKIPEQADFRKYKKERLALFTSLLEPMEDVMYLPDGTSLRVLTAPHPLGGLMFVHENVTDQLALETSYNTLMAVQRETLDNLAEGIAVFGPDGKLRLFNPALAKIWKVEGAFLQTEPHVSDFIETARDLISVPKEFWASYKAEMVGYALDRKPRTGRIECTDHTVIDYQTVPLPDGSVLNSFLNITDSVRVEQALRASNAALATADRLKSDFVANVSYQLRTPLNTISGFADILAEQYFGKLNERQLDYTNTIRAESEKLTRLINDVLDLATIEAGRMTIDPHEVSVASLLNEAKLMTAAWARQQMIDVLIDCPSDIGAFEVDEHRMKQILFNLISNAIKYTPAGGSIALAAWAQEPWIVISVLDTGVGIPDDDRERVFGKFEKANMHLRQSGAGLGLSLVKSFVELHGGRVEIFSDPKDGTRVSCFLPRKASVGQTSIGQAAGA